MFLIAFPVTSRFTSAVSTLCSGSHIFCDTWPRCETHQGRAIGLVSRLALHRKKMSGTFFRESPEGVRHKDVPNKKRTLRRIQPRFLG
ncbi:hypothetical protein [Sedimenticola hydrogenitrophicus]|uniref:hypothetical protein n=1 Tax=Sedimenticola hydrogenitrophicus TaxID=2967975 RepID=UPI0021A2A86A|nr:hypothetical protein [Sedimenticola hydrogenitrophicus]